MTKNNSVFNNAVFCIICLLVLLTPMARGSVHMWAKTLIQIAALISTTLMAVDKLFFVKSSPGKEKSSIPRSVFYIVFFMIIIAIVSTFFSNYPVFASEGLIMLLTYLAIYYVTIESVNTRKKQRILICVIVLTAAFLSFVGLLKCFDMIPFPIWVYQDILWPDRSSLTGPYVNHNHMAGFLEMAIPVLIGLCLTRVGSAMRFLMITIAFFLAISQALTLSRGGWAATICSMIFMLAVLFFQKYSYYKKILLTMTVFVFIVGGLGLGYLPFIMKVSTLTHQNPVDNFQGRLRTWSGTTKLIKDHVFTGTGPGTFAISYPAYQIVGPPFLSTYAHNDYLQFVADTGIFIIPVILGSIFFLFKTGFSKLKSSSSQTRAFALGAMTAIFAIIIHSLSDFNLHIPANIILFTVLSGTLTRQRVLPY